MDFVVNYNGTTNQKRGDLIFEIDAANPMKKLIINEKANHEET